MRTLAALLLLLTCFTFASCENGDWRIYEASEFTIEFPGDAHDTVTMESGLSGVKVYYEPVDGSLDSNQYYSVSMYSLPDSLLQNDTLSEKMLEMDVNIYAWSIGGNLTQTGKKVKSGKISGFEYKVNMEGNIGVVTIRKFLYGRHMYTLLVVTDNEHLNNTDAEHYFNSFLLK
jgi:hypothetical protein